MGGRLDSFGAVNAVVNRYRPDAVLPRHAHSGACLSLVFEGRYVERVGRRSWDCAPLSIVYKPPDVDHSNHIGGRGLRALFLEIPRDTALSLMTEWPGLTDVRCASGDRSHVLVRRVQLLVARHGAGPFGVGDDVVRACLAALGSEPSVPRSNRGAWVRHVRDFVHAHFRRPLTLTAVAKVGGVHPVHLAQTFRRKLGCTFGDYLRQLRLEAARQELDDPTRTIGEIALGAGFADHAHFARTFRARFGQTPSSYRRSNGRRPSA